MAEKEYIEREATLKVISDIISDNKISHKVRAINRKIKQIPAADVVEVRHGEWIKAGVGITERVVCSHCKSDKGSFMLPPFCNQCGAKMDGKEA